MSPERFVRSFDDAARIGDNYVTGSSRYVRPLPAILDIAVGQVIEVDGYPARVTRKTVRTADEVDVQTWGEDNLALGDLIVDLEFG